MELRSRTKRMLVMRKIRKQMKREEMLRRPVGAIDLKQVSLRRCPEMDEKEDGSEGTSVFYLDCERAQRGRAQPTARHPAACRSVQRSAPRTAHPPTAPMSLEWVPRSQR